MKKQGKIKAIPVKEITKGIQVLWENCMKGYIYTIIDVDEDHFVLKSKNTQSFRLSKLHKASIQTLVVEFKTEVVNTLSGSTKRLTDQIPLKFSQWQAAIDNDEVDTNKEVIFQISATRSTKPWEWYARIIPSKSKVVIDKSIIDNIIKYCEDKAVYDKLGQYGDFYYKLKSVTK